MRTYSKRMIHKINPHLLPWLIFSFVMLVAGIILFPTKAISYQTEVPYVETEQYAIEVPYQDVEEYTVQVPYQTQEEYIESIPYEEQEEYMTTERYNELVNSRDCNSNSGCLCTETHWLWGYCTSCNCVRERPVTKYRTVTEYRDVVKTRPVTQYRDETRYRTVTNTRTETREREVRRTRSDTQHKEVNWLFSFPAIIKFRNLP